MHEVDAVVVAVDEESSLRSVSLQEIEEVIGVRRWAIVKSQGDNSLLITVINWGAVRDVAFLSS